MSQEKKIKQTLRLLEVELGRLAGEYRFFAGQKERQDQIVSEYHAVMQQMFDLDWEGGLDYESELPTHKMPNEYLKKMSVQKNRKTTAESQRKVIRDQGKRNKILENSLSVIERIRKGDIKTLLDSLKK